MGFRFWDPYLAPSAFDGGLSITVGPGFNLPIGQVTESGSSSHHQHNERDYDVVSMSWTFQSRDSNNCVECLGSVAWRIRCGDPI